MQENQMLYFPLVAVCPHSLPLSCTYVKKKDSVLLSKQIIRVLFSVPNTLFISVEALGNEQCIKAGLQLVRRATSTEQSACKPAKDLAYKWMVDKRGVTGLRTPDYQQLL